MKPESVPNDLLTAARLEKCWTLAMAAEKANVSIEAYSRWEYGTQIPRLSSLKLLCDAFGKTAEELGFGFLVKKTPLAQEQRDHSEQQEAPSAGFMTLTQEEAGSLFPLLKEDGIMTDEARDWAAWFGMKQAQILTMIRMWRGRASFCDEIQMMVDQEIQMIDKELQQYRAEKHQAISRRQALVTIAALPTTLIWGPGLVSNAALEEFLPLCAASVTSCWHLMKGAGFAAVSDILTRFVPSLATIALRPSPYQQAAARLATQTSIIQGIVVMHQLNFTAREACCKEAVRYATLSQDNKLQAASWMYLGYTYSHCYYPRQPQAAIPIFHKALHALGDETSLLRSDILMGLSEAYAQCKEEQEALHYAGRAQEYFPAYPELDPSFLYADCGLNTLYQWQGKTYLQLVEHFPDAGYQQQATDSLMRSIGIHSISARSANETAIYQADAARVLGELEIYADTLRQAAHMARDIGSRRRYHDAWLVYQRTPERWARESHIQALAKDVFKPLPMRKVNEP